MAAARTTDPDFSQSSPWWVLLVVLLVYLCPLALAQEEISQIPFETIPIQTTFASATGICMEGPVKIDTGTFGDTSLMIVDGDIAIGSSGETAIRMQRTGLGGVDPIFALGRMVIAGDGSPEFRVLYADNETPERAVFEFDNKGIVASVKPPGFPGSHFEGFFAGDSEPLFRLNSFPSMQLELGPGGSSPTDVVLRRSAADTLTILTGGLERLRVDAEGYLRLEPATTAPPAADCNEPDERGRLAIDTAGGVLYVCVDAGWMTLGGAAVLAGG